MTEQGSSRPPGIGAPFRHKLFRRIWIASLLSNFGLLIHGVGAAWAMTELTGRADKVALVQTALMLPTMIVSLAAGAIADMYDRRKVGLSALSLSLTGAASLSIFSFLGLVTPNVILFFTFVIGTGMALFAPAWQASVGEQVPAEDLPSAIALNGISYNIARSFGPAIGGVIVSVAGAIAAYLANTFLYLPLLMALFLWRRVREETRLPPERIGRAMISGARYVIHSPAIRTVLTRTAIIGLVGSSLSSLMPLISRDMLGGGARLYGIMLGAFGLGAVGGALMIARIRQRFSSEAIMRGCSLIMGAATIVVGLSRSPVLTAPALMLCGATWMLSVTTLNISIQLSLPRWVAGRALAAFQASIAGGIAIGSFAWGGIADAVGIGPAILLSGAIMTLLALLGLWLRMPANLGSVEAAAALSDPDVNLALSGRSGPIVIEIDYEIPLDKAREFHDVMQKLQLARQRNGAYGWSLTRDISRPELWTERYHCPTWHDYLRQRSRMTEAEHGLQLQATAFHRDPATLRVRRMLERPFGSVRWKDDTPDRQANAPMVVHPPSSGI
jgi:MFS family permease